MNEKRRNIAIIAHVDHGKTTLVDGMLRQSHIFRSNEQVAERVMDSGELERERGITILSKNTAIWYKGVKINIVDTPGHADFGGEVERVLNMVDGALLVVDAFEGPMPQTKYVLRKALEHKLKILVVINKIDRPEARLEEVYEEVLELFMELDADDEQLDFPVIYTAAKAGIAKRNIDDNTRNLTPLLDTILKELPAPEGELNAPLQMVVTTLEADEYVGKIAIGRIQRGRIKSGETVAIISEQGIKRAKVSKVFSYEGLNRVEAGEAEMGEIVALTGLSEVSIGDTVADAEQPEALPSIRVDEPTLSVTIGVSTSPFAGTEGQYVTSRHLRDRLFKEARTNVALRVEETDSADIFKVSGRGELHLSILIETMRREGYEMQIGKPEVVYKLIDGKRYEPIEDLTVEVSADYMGVVMESLGRRKAELKNMQQLSGYMRLNFLIPARG
ncbi:MAG: GTP-binding protein, partial [Muribaculaceae bacterium]|nr:GTP-binding protein [Muribaculaceae bacterium]